MIEAESRPEQAESRLAGVESLVRQILQHGHFELTFAIRKGVESPEAPVYVVEFSGPDRDLLLERNASLLDALENVVLKAVRLDEDLIGKVAFDCENWRQMRAEELKLMARVAAERVAETGDSFALNPMSSRERRIIHLALKDHPGVRTVSEGFGQDRKVVILPAPSTGQAV